MRALNPAELKSIEQFFQLTQESLLKVMSKYLKTKYDKVYISNDYLMAIGNISVAVVAHLDTVFTTPPENIFYDRVKNVMWSPEGLGADDRAGVYAIIQLLKRGLRPTVIFTTDEEKGALGASALIGNFPEAPVELNYIIQLDRRGSVDCVFYDCDNPTFESYVESFGFVTAYGTFSDISVICPAWEVAGVNLSIGYIDEHSYSELLYIGNMLSTIDKVAKMLKDISNSEKFEYIPAYKNYKMAFGYNSKEDYGWDPSYGVSKQLWRSWHTPNSMCKCGHCNIEDYEYNLIPVKQKTGDIIFICSSCINNMENVDWCHYCGEPFIIDTKCTTEARYLCSDCLQEASEYAVY